MNKLEIKPEQANNNLSLLPPEEFIFDDVDLLKASLAASSAIASLNATIRTDLSNVNHGLNMLSPLLVPEAVTSSGVENIVTTNERVYEARLLVEDELRPQDKEVMRYVDALIVGGDELDEKHFL